MKKTIKNITVITGATGGMGVQIARSIKDKSILLLADLDMKKLKKLQSDLKKLKIDSEIMACDVSNLDNIKSLADKTKKLGNFKAMVHTAGVSGSMKDAEAILKINLCGTKMLMDAFYELADNSVFINVASMAGHMVPDSPLYNKILLDPLNPKFLKKMRFFTRNMSQYAYSFSKKGVILLTENEVGKWGEKNSRIISISPGMFKTPMADLEAENNPAMGKMLENNPIPRYGNAKEIATLVKYLLSKDSEYINGVDILIDGGITSHMKNNDILGLKENKTPVISPLISYTMIFLLLPFLIKALTNNEIYESFLNIALYLYNPALVLFITIFSVKNKLSPYLIISPMIIFGISCFINYNFNTIINLLSYGLLALITSLLVILIRNKE